MKINFGPFRSVSLVVLLSGGMLSLFLVVVPLSAAEQAFDS
jgi:hypothetical protein